MTLCLDFDASEREEGRQYRECLWERRGPSVFGIAAVGRSVLSILLTCIER